LGVEPFAVLVGVRGDLCIGETVPPKAERQRATLRLDDTTARTEAAIGGSLSEFLLLG